MARRCSVCDHGSLKAIDLALATDNGSLRVIADQFKLSKTALQRHKATHLRPAAVAAAERREELRAEDLVDRLRSLQARTEALLDRAEREKARPADAARVVRECRENLATIGKLLGAFPTGPGTLIDNRTQILNLEGLTIDELRSLARLGDGDRRASNGDLDSGSVGVNLALEPAIVEENDHSIDAATTDANGDANEPSGEAVER